MLPKLCVSLLFTAAVCHAQLAISEIRVEGNSRLPAAGIVAASGLRAGSTIEKSDLDAAGQKLFATGLFTAFNYLYTPKPGADPPAYIVTLIVTEDRAQTRVVIDIPNYPEEQLWREIKSADPLIDRVIPDSDAASNYYTRAIEAALAKAGHPETVVMRPETDLATHAGRAVFQPARLPKVAAIRFEGLVSDDITDCVVVCHFRNKIGRGDVPIVRRVCLRKEGAALVHA